MYFDKSDVTICGNVGNPPTLRFTKSKQTPVSNFRVAISQGRDPNTNDQRPAEWITAVIFGEQARRVSEDFHVGDRVILVGNLRIRPFSRDDGSVGTAIELWCDDAGLSNKWDHIAAFKTERPSTNGSSPDFDPTEVEEEIDAAVSGLDTQPETIQQPATGMHAEQPVTVPPTQDIPEDEEPF